MILNYDPNHSFGTHTVELTFAKWDYHKTVQVNVNGNTKGLTILRHALSNYIDELDFRTHEDGIEFTFTNANDEELEVWVYGDDVETELEECLVAARIINFVPEITQRKNI